jgi:hypothetical protein
LQLLLEGQALSNVKLSHCLRNAQGVLTANVRLGQKRSFAAAEFSVSQ